LIEEKSLQQFSVAIIPSYLISSIKFPKGGMEAMNIQMSGFVRNEGEVKDMSIC
jgi:hypothetical protein